MDVEKNGHLFDHLILPDEDNQYNGAHEVKYKEEITVRAVGNYPQATGKYTVYNMKTTSRKFKTA